MDDIKEHLLLEELQYLCHTALEHSRAVEAAAAVWLESDNLLTLLQDHADRRSIQKGLAWREKWDDAIRTRTASQASLFTNVEAFLALFGRISLIVFPSGEERIELRRARGQTLRRALGISDDHGISDKLLRNKWMHFDEVFDGMWRGASAAINPQRFTKASDLTVGSGESTARLFVVDKLELRYHTIGHFDLRALFEAVADVRTRADRALETWAQRWSADGHGRSAGGV